MQKKYTEEVGDIIERFPKIYSNSSFLGFLIIILFLISSLFIISYPDALKGEAFVTSKVPSSRLTSLTSGKIRFLVSNKENVKKGEIVALVENSASLSDVALVKKNMNNIRQDISFFSRYKNLQLGELAPSFRALESSLESYSLFVSNNSYDNKLKFANFIVQQREKIIASLKKTIELNNDREKVIRDNTTSAKYLFERNAITLAEFNRSQIEAIENDQQRQKLELELLDYSKSYQNAMAEIDILNSDKKTKIDELKLQIETNFQKLKAELLQWENRYLIIAPVNGKIEYLDFLADQNFINSGREIVEIIPNSESVCEVYLQNENAGKLRRGQNVRIKLDDYPYAEFGVLEGIVKDFSSTQIVDRQNHINTILVEVSLKNQLITNQNIGLVSFNRMKGVAEILTTKQTLFKKLFQRLVKNLPN